MPGSLRAPRPSSLGNRASSQGSEPVVADGGGRGDDAGRGLGRERAIGGSLTAAPLRARGDEVTALVRRAPGTGEARWDPVAGTLDTDAVEGAGAVVHLAGAGIGDRLWSASRRQEILSSRVQSTTLLTSGRWRRAASPRRAGERRSAVGFYGNRGDEELTEDSGPGHGFLADVCRAWRKRPSPPPRPGCGSSGSDPGWCCPGTAAPWRVSSRSSGSASGAGWEVADSG